MVSHPSALQWADVSNFAGVMNDVIGYRSTKLQPDKTHINIIHLHIQCRSTDGSHSCFYGIQLMTIHHNNVTSASQKTTMAAEICASFFHYWSQTTFNIGDHNRNNISYSAATLS